MAVPPSLILINMDFWYDSCVFCLILNIPIKVGKEWFYSKEMTTHFRNSRWRLPSWTLVNMRFWSDSCDLCQILHMHTKINEEWCHSKEIATHYWHSQWRRTPSWNLVMCIFELTIAFLVRFSTFSPCLVRICLTVKTWQPFFEIQNGVDRHLEFWLMCTFDMTVAFYCKLPTFSSTPPVNRSQPNFTCF